MSSTTFSGPVTSTNGFIGSITGAVAATTITATGTITVDSATAVVAGGDAAILMTTTAGLGIYVGSGVPTVSAAKGSLYLRTDGTTTNDRAYINTNGSTTWTALTTAA